MNTKALKTMVAIGLAVVLAGARLAAQEVRERDSVRIGWEEFRKLLELDKDEIVLSWEEFQRILAQTGFKYVPPFALKEEKVVLTRAQFKGLLDRMRPPADPVAPPPAEFLMTRAVYKGALREGSARIRAEFEVEIFKGRAGGYTDIPLFPSNLALRNALCDGRPALIVIRDGRHTLTTEATGSHRVSVELSLKAPTDQGPWALSFPIPQTPVTELEIDLPFKDIDVEIAGAQELETGERGGLTHVAALLAPTTAADVRWRRRPREIAKGPAKIYAETVALLSVEDDALRIQAAISLSILQNTVSAVGVRVPRGFSVLDVRGNGIGDWREVKTKDGSEVEVQFEYPKQGQFSLTLTAERPLPDPTMTVGFEGFEVREAVREKGFLGIELKSASEVTPGTIEGLDRLDVSELPPALINRSQKPLLFGFKYLRHPYALDLGIAKHEALPVIGTVVDAASGVTLFTEDGKLVHRVLYTVRNTSKQFMTLELPAGAQVWSIFVGGGPAKPRFHGSKILIPLNRSVAGEGGLAAFEVELVYFERASRFGRSGRKASSFPVPDIIVSQTLWSVYLPQGYRPVHFGGTVEKEKAARGVRPLFGGGTKVVRFAAPGAAADPDSGKDDKERAVRDAERAKKQFSANLALSEAQIVQQMTNEMRFSRRMDEIQSGAVPAVGGTLPIRISIPASGQLFRFAKTLVSEEPLTLGFSYVSNGLLWGLGLIALAAVLTALFVFRRRIAAAVSRLRTRSRTGL